MPQRRSGCEDGAAKLAPRTRLFVTRAPVGGTKIARAAPKGLFNLIRGLGPVRLAGTRMEAVVAGQIDQCLVVDNPVLVALAGDRRRHAVVE